MTLGLVCNKISEQPPGKVIVLDGPSGCGKTAMLYALRDKFRKKVIIWSIEKMCLELVKCLKAELPTSTVIENINCDYFCIEDIDFMDGKECTMYEIALLIKMLIEQDISVILTGIGVKKKAKYLLKCLPEYLYIKEQYIIYFKKNKR